MYDLDSKQFIKQKKEIKIIIINEINNLYTSIYI
jgi:hypothetical protein